MKRSVILRRHLQVERITKVRRDHGNAIKIHDTVYDTFSSEWLLLPPLRNGAAVSAGKAAVTWAGWGTTRATGAATATGLPSGIQV